MQGVVGDLHFKCVELVGALKPPRGAPELKLDTTFFLCRR